MMDMWLRGSYLDPLVIGLPDGEMFRNLNPLSIWGCGTGETLVSSSLLL